MTTDAAHDVAARAVCFLLSRQSESGAICDPDFYTFNMWETINALLAIVTWQERLDIQMQPWSDRALAFLSTYENSQGMVYHNHLKEYDDSCCLETSSEYARLLITLRPESRRLINKKLDTIREYQTTAGCWRVLSPAVPDAMQELPCATGFALRALSLGAMEANEPQLALNFLVKTQKEEGHWGQEWAYYGNPFYVMAPILDVLSHCCHFGDSVELAADYLIQSQHDDGRWFVRLHDYPNFTSPEFQTALALQCCADAQFGADDEVVSRGLHWLIDRQRPNGSWDGGFFPSRYHKKNEDTYATAQALLTLARFSPTTVV